MSLINDTQRENDPRKDTGDQGRLPTPQIAQQPVSREEAVTEALETRPDVMLEAPEPYPPVTIDPSSPIPGQDDNALPTQEPIQPSGDSQNTEQERSDVEASDAETSIQQSEEEMRLAGAEDVDTGRLDIESNTPRMNRIDTRGNVWDLVNTPKEQNIIDVEEAQKGIYAPLEKEFLSSETIVPYNEVDPNDNRQGLDMRTLDSKVGEFSFTKPKEEFSEFLFNTTNSELVNNLMSEDSAWLNMEFNSLENPIRNGETPGMIRSIFPDGYKEGLEEGSEFAPFRGYRQLWQGLKKNPWKLLTAPLTIPMAMWNGRYGEYGDGMLGYLFYGLSLPQNVVLGGATDIYNIATGNKNPTSNKPNVLQAVLGKDYDFTARAGEDKPLAFVGSAVPPATIKEWKERSILNRALLRGTGLDLILQATGFEDKKLPKPQLLGSSVGDNEKLLGRLYQTPEFIAAMITGAIVLDPLEVPTLLGKAGSKAFQKSIQKAATTTGAAVTLSLSTVVNNAPVFRLSTDTVDNLTPLVRQLGNPSKGLAIVPDHVKYVRRSEEALTNNAKNLNLFPQTYDKLSPNELTKFRTQQPELFSRYGRPGAIVPTQPFNEAEELQRIEGQKILDSILPNPENYTNEQVAKVLPQRLLPPADDMDFARQYLAKEQEVIDISKELNEIGAELLEQEQILKQSGDALEQLPDVGRQDLLDPVVSDVSSKTPAVVNDVTVSVNNKDVKFLREAFDVDDPDLKIEFFSPEEIRKKGTNIIGKEPEIGGRVQRVKEFLQTSDEIYLPRAVRKSDGSLTFSDGRHRTKYLMDSNVEAIPILIEDDLSLLPDELSTSLSEFTWYHGTKVQNLELNTIDPFQGSARGELGVGVYLTNNLTSANNYAFATPARNAPPIESRQWGDAGRLYQIEAILSNTLNADEPLGELSAPIKQIVKSVGFNEEALNKFKKFKVNRENIAQLFDAINLIAADVYDEFPEELVLETQRQINIMLKDRGYNAIAKVDDKTGETVLNVLDNSLLIPYEIDVPQRNYETLDQTVFRFNADSRTAEIFDDIETANVNYRESAFNLQTEMSQQTASNYTELQQEAIERMDEFIDMEYDLETSAADEIINKRIADEKMYDRQNQSIIDHNNKPDDNWC